MTVGGRRILAHNLGMCWDTIGIGPGVTVGVEVVDRRTAGGDGQRAIAGWSEEFRTVLRAPEPRGRRRWWNRRCDAPTG